MCPTVSWQVTDKCQNLSQVSASPVCAKKEFHPSLWILLVVQSVSYHAVTSVVSEVLLSGIFYLLLRKFRKKKIGNIKLGVCL